jgi:hypothetical protein
MSPSISERRYASAANKRSLARSAWDSATRRKFGEENVALITDENGTEVAVGIALPDRTMSSRVKVNPTVAEEEVKVPFVPFPVALPKDPELVWRMGAT